MYSQMTSFPGSSTTSRWRSTQDRRWAKGSRIRTTWGLLLTPSSTGCSTSTTTETTTLRWGYDNFGKPTVTNLFPSSSVTFNPPGKGQCVPPLINHEAMAVTTQVGFITFGQRPLSNNPASPPYCHWQNYITAKNINHWTATPWPIARPPQSHFALENRDGNFAFGKKQRKTYTSSNFLCKLSQSRKCQKFSGPWGGGRLIWIRSTLT